MCTGALMQSYQDRSTAQTSIGKILAKYMRMRNSLELRISAVKRGLWHTKSCRYTKRSKNNLKNLLRSYSWMWDLFASLTSWVSRWGVYYTSWRAKKYEPFCGKICTRSRENLLWNKYQRGLSPLDRRGFGLKNNDSGGRCPGGMGVPWKITIPWTI